MSDVAVTLSSGSFRIPVDDTKPSHHIKIYVNAYQVATADVAVTIFQDQWKTLAS